MRSLMFLVLLAFGCGDEIVKKSSNSPANNEPGSNNSTLVNPQNNSNNSAQSNNSNNLPASNNNPESNNSPGSNNSNNSPSSNNSNNSNNQTVDPVECGDGLVQEGEQCDGLALVTCEELGFSGGTVTCSNTCQHVVQGCFHERCGDGVVNDSEECDGSAQTTCQALGFDGGSLSCSSQCTFNVNSCTACGDGVREGTEACDDGAQNGAYGRCRADCSGPGPRCGDGVRNGQETCDDGAQNGQYNRCNATCSGTGPRCGDGVRNGQETCDDGAENGQYAKCNTSCTGPGPRCGDGIVNGAEQCDGTTNATCATVGSGTPTCDSSCSIDYSSCVVTPPEPGDFWITEIMADPQNRYDSEGEWFELRSNSTGYRNLLNCVVESQTSTGAESFTINQSVDVPPGSFVTFARDVNVGFTADFVYNSQINLNNTSDTLTLKCPAWAGSSILYEIDTTQYSSPPTGATWSRDNWGIWCSAVTPFATGDLGTPGVSNPECP